MEPILEENSNSFIHTDGHKFSDHTMKMHILKIWNERLHDDDGVFDSMEFCSENEERCMINEDNLVEFLEALDIQDYVTEEEII